MRILLVEDEIRLSENIVAALRESGLVVDHAPDGEDGSHMAEQDVYDAIILDLMLPGKSGQMVLSDLRRKRLQTPVLILTAQEGKESIIELLNAGPMTISASPSILENSSQGSRLLFGEKRESRTRSCQLPTSRWIRFTKV
jgi:two-component system response regulator PhoP